MICYGKENKKWCACCDRYKVCFKEEFANVVINRFDNYSEIIIYKDAFSILGNSKISDVDKTRKWNYNDNDVLVPVKDNATIKDLQKTLKSSRKRSLDNLYGFALCNKWNYFITLTFDNSNGQKYDNSYVKKCWSIFRKKLQRHFPNIKILLVPENHENGGLHFHGFLGNCNLDNWLVEAKNNAEFINFYNSKLGKKIYKLDDNGNKIKNAKYGQNLTTRFGDLIYNFKENLFTYGFTTLVKIKDDNNNLKLVNYLTKYISKGENSNVAYNKKSYYHTNNLLFKNKDLFNFNENELNDFLNRFYIYDKMELKKENERFKVITINHTT